MNSETPRLEWTFEQAQEADQRFREEHRDALDREAPLSRWLALQDIEKKRTAVETGDGFALMAVIRECANFDFAMPAWAASEFIRRYDAVLNYRAASWDEAFGRPNPKGAHLHALRKRRLKRPAVWLAVIDAMKRDPTRPIDAELFADIGATLHIGKTLAEELYREACEINGLSAAEVKRHLVGS